MESRKIIQIDEEKCIGCGLCILNCAEGAMKIIDGKARIVSDSYCDGLGLCMPHCPQDALKLVERKAQAYDREAVEKRKTEDSHNETAKPKDPPVTGGCPGSRAISFKEPTSGKNTSKIDSGDIEINIKSQLRQWPVQLKLVGTKAEYFDNADLLVTADCVPFAYPNYHLDLLKGKVVVIGCPILDDVQDYTEKLTEIIDNNSVKSITVAYMEVPCCGGLVRAVDSAIANSSKNIPVNKIKIGIQGERF